MTASDLGLLDMWDLTLPPVPPRSRLFALLPVGIGTPMVECLTGYVTRVAAAHSVIVRRLVESEILPHFGRPYLLSPVEARRSCSFWQHSETRALNGTGSLARDFVRVLEMLTLRDDLQWLTLRPWANVLPMKGLLRRQRAWCPACYEEWRQAGTVIYEPLLWTLAPVTACVRHLRHLQLACPYPDCRRLLPVLAPYSRPGSCSACGRWLGMLAEHQQGSVTVPTDGELQAQRWTGESLGELLAGAPGLLRSPTKQRLLEVLALYNKELAGGNVTRFAREVGITMGTVAQWCWGLTLPSLPFLLQASFRLGTTPWHLLTHEPDSVPGGAAARPHPPVATLLDAPRRASSPRQAFDTAAMRRTLEAHLACEEQPPPPMRLVARRLGHGHAELIHHLPELCHAISARYLADQHRKAIEKQRRLCAEIRHASTQLHHQGIYPSANRIASLISQPGFVRDPVAMAARKDVLRELGWQP